MIDKEFIFKIDQRVMELRSMGGVGARVDWGGDGI